MKIIAAGLINYRNAIVCKTPQSIHKLEADNKRTCETPLPSTNLIFKGLTQQCITKKRGMLMHITSLPAERSFCGQFLDKQTEQFIQWMKRSKQTHWITNPLNELEEDLCPYNAVGRFSRNKFVVNLNKLVSDEYGNLLNESELPDDIYSPTFTLEMLKKQKEPRFVKAYERFKSLDKNASLKQEYNIFVQNNNKLWLDAYASYNLLSKKYGNNWMMWDKELQIIPEKAKNENVLISKKTVTLLKQNGASEKSLTDDIELYKFEQFLFDKQLKQEVEYLNKNGINFMTDLAIGVSPTGVDTWSRKNIFLLDDNFHPTKVSGCVPEEPYGYTQVWGHALFNYDSDEFWKYQEDSIRQLLKISDLRLDHFVGYVNRAEIPVEYKKPDGTILKGQEIFKSREKGGMGKDFFLPEWISDISNKRNSNGESMFDLFIRIAKECGKEPENAYILESFGDLSKTDAYKRIEKQYGMYFTSQVVQDFNLRYKADNKKNVAVLTGNHDLPPLREKMDDLIGKGDKKSLIEKSKFYIFCKKELNLTKEEMKNPNEIYKNLLKWFYIKNDGEVQTTLQDALGIYWRPNIPGSWNGMYDKYLQKTTKEALLPYWSKVFPPNFLINDNKSGVLPGYKENADKFVELMNS
ncbi:MAG: 4-alpha-glucanotransferase [bacterium]|nr:4-alpha-glucanotransferase [bacterium]